MKKRLILAAVVVLMMAALSISVSANTTTPAPPDMTAAMQTSLDGLLTQIFAIIGIVVPVVLAIVGGKLAITKGISIFKSLTNKGG